MLGGWGLIPHGLKVRKRVLSLLYGPSGKDDFPLTKPTHQFLIRKLVCNFLKFISEEIYV